MAEGILTVRWSYGIELRFDTELGDEYLNDVVGSMKQEGAGKANF